MSMSSVPCSSSIRFLYWSFSFIDVDTLLAVAVDCLLPRHGGASIQSRAYSNSDEIGIRSDIPVEAVRCVAESLLLRSLHHLHDGKCLAIPERDDDAFDLDVAFQPVQRDTGECGAHLETVEACCAGGVFSGGEDQRTEPLSGKVGMDEDGAHLSGVGCWVEQLGFTTGATVCAEESLAFGPSAA